MLKYFSEFYFQIYFQPFSKTIMNSIEFLNQILQSVNSLHGIVFTLRNDIDTLRKDLSNVKDSFSGLDQQRSVDEYNEKNEQQIQVIMNNMDNTKLMVEEMQNKLSSVYELHKNVSVDEELDYFKTISKETSEKLKNLEIAFTLKMNTLERSIKNIPKSITIDEVQSMIDKSITQLLESPKTVSLATLTDSQEQTLFISTNDVKELTETGNETVNETVNDINEIEAETPVDVVIQSIEPVPETKPKRKKPAKKTK